METDQVTKFKFVSKISTMGEGTRIIWIPKQFHKQIENLEDKQIRVTIDDEI